MPKARVDFCELGCTRPSAPCSPFDVRSPIHMPLFRNAHECLAAISEQYRSLTSYADDGFVRAFGSRGPKTCWFQTLFKQPQQFRFEFSTPHPYPPLRHIVTTSVVGTSGTAAYFASRHPRTGRSIEPVETLELAVAGATGISHGAAHTIGSLLFNSVRGFSLQMLKRPRFRAYREFGGTLCSVITGQHPRGGRITVWFGRDDLLLRKVVRHWAKSEEVRLNIRPNAEVSDSAFGAPSAET